MPLHRMEEETIRRLSDAGLHFRPYAVGLDVGPAQSVEDDEEDDETVPLRRSVFSNPFRY